MQKAFKPEEKLILLSADICPDKAGLISLDNCLKQINDWDQACKLLIDRATAPLFLNLLPKLNNASLVPDSIKEKLERASLKIRARNMILTAHFAQIISRFTEAQIPVIALKGVFLSEWLYGTPGLRQFSDLDLLVPPNQCYKALEILEAMDYRSDKLRLSDFITTHSTPVHEAPMHKNGVSVEIHTHIHSINESYHVHLERMWQDAVPIRLHGVNTLVFCPEDLLMHLCLHLDKHFRYGFFQFTCLYDLLNMINHKGNMIDWQLFEERCHMAGAENRTYKYLSLISEFMGARLPETVAALASGKRTQGDLRKMQNILQGRGKERKDYVTNLLQCLHSFANKADSWHYLADLFFPSRAFMMKRYKLKHAIQLTWFYPYRSVKAINGVILMLVNKIRYGMVAN
jgi:hypothetical protein